MEDKWNNVCNTHIQDARNFIIGTGHSAIMLITHNFIKQDKDLLLNLSTEEIGIEKNCKRVEFDTLN